jgi:hypothetical protein
MNIFKLWYCGRLDRYTYVSSNMNLQEKTMDVDCGGTNMT